jgi:hypothetical protein
MEPQNKLQKNIGIVLGIVVMLGVLSVTIFLGKKPTGVSTTDQTSTNNPTTPDTPAQTPAPVAPPVPQNPPPVPVPVKVPPVIVPKKIVSVYRDGTYSLTVSYSSPGGEDQIAVSLTLKNDIVTNVSVTPLAGDRTSERYQSRFISNYKQFVIGKNIATLFLSNVSGSSLTTKAFNNALAQIKVKAKA